MRAYYLRGIAALIVLPLAAFVLAQFSFAPRQHEDMEARLTVEAAKRTSQRGLGEATFTLTITGPATLDVEPPHLSHATAAWKEERLTSTRVEQNHRAIWSQVIRLKQIKPGLEPLPDVTVRFRSGPDDEEWWEENWIDILRHVRDAQEPPLPSKTPQQLSWLRRWGFALLLVATAVLVLFAWRMKRRGRRTLPLTVEQWALREIERIEREPIPAHGETKSYHTHLSYVVRRYLAERFRLHALQQTTAEFLAAAHEIPPETAALLGEFFQRCDLAKFADASTPPEECRHTAELARELVRRTGSVSCRVQAPLGS